MATTSTGSLLVVGAYFQQVGNAHNCGAVYTYSPSNLFTPSFSWKQQQMLTCPFLQTVVQFNFGASVAVAADGSVLVASATGYSVDNVHQAGAVFIYALNQSTGMFPSTYTYMVAVPGTTELGLMVAVSGNGSVVVASTVNGVFAMVFNALTNSYNTSQIYASRGAVAVSSDGQLAVLGSMASDNVVVMQYSGGQWTQLTSFPLPATLTSLYTVSISSDASLVAVTALLTAYEFTSSYENGVATFTRTSSSTWAYAASVTGCAGYPTGSAAYFGLGLAVVNDSAVYVGAPTAENPLSTTKQFGVGATCLFALQGNSGSGYALTQVTPTMQSGTLAAYESSTYGIGDGIVVASASNGDLLLSASYYFTGSNNWGRVTAFSGFGCD